METAVKLAGQSDSIILILLIVIVALVIALIPVIKTLSGISHSKRKEEYERESRLLQVIEKNTEVNSALKTLIEADQKHCSDCQKQQMMAFKHIQDNQETTNMKLVEIHTMIKKEGQK